MPRQIYRAEELEHLVHEGAQLVDVLSPREYARDHIPGAINLHLKTITAASTAHLDRTRPVIVYCNDFS